MPDDKKAPVKGAMVERLRYVIGNAKGAIPGEELRKNFEEMLTQTRPLGEQMDFTWNAEREFYEDVRTSVFWDGFRAGVRYMEANPQLASWEYRLHKGLPVPRWVRRITA